MGCRCVHTGAAAADIRVGKAVVAVLECGLGVIDILYYITTN
jgi:hypothetical protein